MSNENKKQQQLKTLIESLVEEESSLIVEDDDLYKTFIEPFTDVIQTAKHGLESSIQSVAHNARKVAMQTAAALLPFIAADEVTRLGSDEKARLKTKLDALNLKYAGVLDRNIQALQSKDAAAIAFLFNPALTLGAHAGAWAAGKGVATASSAIASNLDFLSVLTAHVPGVGQMVGGLSKKFETLSHQASAVAGAVVSKPLYSPGGSSGGGFGGGGYDDYGDDGGGYGESVSRGKNKKIITEAFSPEQLNQKMGAIMQQLLARKDIQKAIQTSTITRTMQMSRIEALMDRVNKVAKFTTLDHFRQFAGPKFSKFEDQIKDKMPEDTSPEAIKAFEDTQVGELKKVYKGIYTKYLETIAKDAPALSSEIMKAKQVLNNLG